MRLQTHAFDRTATAIGTLHNNQPSMRGLDSYATFPSRSVGCNLGNIHALIKSNQIKYFPPHCVPYFNLRNKTNKRTCIQFVSITNMFRWFLRSPLEYYSYTD